MPEPQVTAEFTTEPFRGEGEPPEHAVAARDRLRAAGLEPDFGPLGTSVRGSRDVVLPALAEVCDAALAAGAHRITLQVTVDRPTAPGAGS
ncbi:thiamine-binding protein [Saccharopolyspora gregorii]|uniref:Thiamine-binding protein domain-containing protein n=1 Tax=Saccharopolyspora gregorii TaxID=33914 RepID=A0ABP6RY65_9PSEU